LPWRPFKKAAGNNTNTHHHEQQWGGIPWQNMDIWVVDPERFGLVLAPERLASGQQWWQGTT
jgi:hypothetical protein